MEKYEKEELIVTLMEENFEKFCRILQIMDLKKETKRILIKSVIEGIDNMLKKLNQSTKITELNNCEIMNLITTYYLNELYNKIPFVQRFQEGKFFNKVINKEMKFNNVICETADGWEFNIRIKEVK